MRTNLLITRKKNTALPCIDKVKPSGHQTNYNLLIMDLNLYLGLSGFAVATGDALEGCQTNVGIDEMEIDHFKSLRDIWTDPTE